MKHGHRFLIGALVTVVLAVALALLTAGGQVSRASPGVIYVDADATGANNGGSWTNAYTTLQPALEAAVDGDEIWVAAGVYLPTREYSPGDPRSATFQMVNGVELYGGFDPSAGAVAWGHRDSDSHVAILSGNTGDLDLSDDNSFHVFYHPAGTNLDATAVLDGFTIAAGYADGPSPHNHGAGMYNSGSSPTLTNCIFSHNTAAHGGGMSNNAASNPEIRDCTFEYNTAAYGGGGMSNQDSSPRLNGCHFESNSTGINGGGMANYDAAPQLTGCTFETNHAVEEGGGMHNWGSTPVLSGCSFVGNTVQAHGGGMSNNSSAPVLTGVIFEGNIAGQAGGGLFILGEYYDGSYARLSDCTFAGNQAADGAGMYNEGSKPELTDCSFIGNEASALGGGMHNEAASPVLRNCTFARNTGMECGGGIFNSASSPTLTNCTLWGNSVLGVGAGLCNSGGSAPAVTNSILWANTPDQIYDVYSSPVVTYSDVQGGYLGTGNISQDPLFLGVDEDDFHLSSSSPCIDVGNNGAPKLPLFDFEGDARTLDGNLDGVATVDMGVDEVVPGGVAPLEVEIDIRPGSPSNTINLNSGGTVPVAILSDGDFDATEVSPDTVLFAEAGQVDFEFLDVDSDGDVDLLLEFMIWELDLDSSSTEATLTGRTIDGVLVEGTDSVNIVSP